MNHASLFSGIGGPEIAAAMLGWDNVFHCEINDFGRKILEYWFPNSQSYEDIKTTNFKQWRGKVDVLTGGFPCQPFSYAGQRRGADDDRYLWPQMLRAIDEIRPAWVVGENVAGIVSMVEQGTVSHLASQATLFDEGDGVQRYRQEQTFTIERVCRDFESLGYSVQPMLVPACSVGAPHRRDRVFIIANSSDTSDVQLNGSEFGRRWDDIGQTIPELGSGYCQATEGRTPSDTDLQRRNKPNPATESSRTSRLYREEDFNGRDTKPSTDTSEQPCERMRPQQHEHRREEQEQPRGGGGEDCGVAGCVRWRNFPTVSPVHRGNDGLPFDVDDLAIPFSKWRTESLKAYGNAIVPQVIYEIFRAIQIVENQLNKC